MDHSAAGDHFHAVRFYESKESLCRIVAEFISEGIAAGQPALIVGRPEHRAGILDDLRERGIDVDGLQAAGDLLMLDARETLATFMVDGQPNTALFEKQASQTLERLSRGRNDCTIWAYGEMVDVLWEADQPVAAIVLEMLWNKFVSTWKLCLLCGYSSGHVYRKANVTDICGQHTHVFGADAARLAAGDQPFAP